MESFPAEVISALEYCEHDTRLSIIPHMTSVSTLTAGKSNRNFLINTPTQDYVLRVNSAESSFICDRENEIECWRIAEQSSLAPKLFWVSGDNNFYLSEYIQQPIDKGYGLKEVQKLLNALSTLPLPTKIITCEQQWQIYQQQVQSITTQLLQTNNFDLLTEYEQWNKLKSKLDSLQPNIKGWVDFLESLNVKPQFCHRDLNPENILIKNGQLICIDFEYACQSHPLFELASLIENHDLTESDKKLIVTDYLKSHSELNLSNRVEFEIATKLFWSFYDYWVVIMAGRVLIEQLESSSEITETSKQFKEYYSLAK
ncbi:phosphotransferase [Parashewanella tropica]|uniref:phosphotransferase n=1 Tax=Parashewanella tropica TaxID=2547970 RepID=UPI00105A9AE0|nr:phosphotransferase [Parashewanella tropica]